MAAQVKAAKEELVRAITAFNCAKSTVSNTLKSTNVNKRSLSTKVKTLEEALSTLNAAHGTWVAKAEFNDEQLSAEAHSNTWLQTVWAEYDTLHDQADDILNSDADEFTPPSQTNKKKLSIATSLMKSIQTDIAEKVANLVEKCKNDITPQSHKLFVEIVQSVSSTLDDQYEQVLQNILQLDPANLDTNLHQYDTFRQKFKKEVLSIQMNLADKAPKTTSSVQSIQMEKSKAPTFTGRTIDYPEFKRGWQKVAGKCWDDANQVEQIKLKVNEETRRIISRCNTMIEVWEALDIEFAQEQEVINAVDTELKTLRSSNLSTAEYIVKLKHHLPCLEEALKGVNGLEHLCSPDRVNYMAENFYERTMYDWEYFRSKAKGPTYNRFTEFIKDRYDVSRNMIARMKSLSLNAAPNMPSEKHFGNTVSHIDSQSCKHCEKWVARDGVYTCPACGRGTPKGEAISHCLDHCGVYLNMSPNDRSSCIEQAKFCPIHLLGSHDYAACNMKNDGRFVCGINSCKKHHHKSLHDSTTSFVASIHATDLNASNVLLLVQSIDTPTGQLTTFYDNCSTCCLITNAAAQRLGLMGEPIIMEIITATGKTSIDSFMYSVTLMDKEGESHNVSACALENISNKITRVDISGVKGEFSDQVQNIWTCLQDRPHGEIDFLLGLNVCGLHPVDMEISQNLRVMSSMFGNGYLLCGSHPSITSASIEWNETVNNIHSSRVAISTQVVNLTGVSVRPKRDFFEAEGMGVEPPRRCGNCMNCRECGFRAQQLSQEHQYQYHVIESKVTYNETQKCFYVEYPFTEDPKNVLSNNYKQVVKIAERLETKLMKEGNLDGFNTEFEKMLSFGAIVELSQEDRAMWAGAVHYVSLQHVLNEDSSTTPLRIVTNSSLADRNGNSLNTYLMKGPNPLSNQWDVLTRWRMYETALCSDITKAYYSLLTGEVEKHVRRVVWRYGNKDANWRIFAFRTVSFGDRPAGVILEVAIKKTAKLFWDIDPEAAHKIMNDRYVDDFASGGSATLVLRLIGNCNADFECDGTLSAIMNLGSMRLKVLVASGETDPLKLQKLGNSVLGIGWDPTSDTIIIHFSIDMSTLDKALLSLRTILSIINGIYDLLGLCAPFTLRLKVAFRDLFAVEPKLGWDDPIPSRLQELWWSLFNMMSSVKQIVFPRATRPKHAIGKCELVCFFDGSDFAFAAVLYVRWTLQDGSVYVVLMGCKCRVTPLLRISTPRSELSAAVLASRLVLSTVRSLSVSNEIPDKIWIIGDSECTLASVEKTSAPFGEYFGNRIGEIQDNQSKIEQICPVGINGEWYHCSSDNNGADIATRLDTDC